MKLTYYREITCIIQSVSQEGCRPSPEKVDLVSAQVIEEKGQSLTRKLHGQESPVLESSSVNVESIHCISSAIRSVRVSGYPGSDHSSSSSSSSASSSHYRNYQSSALVLQTRSPVLTFKNGSLALRTDLLISRSTYFLLTCVPHCLMASSVRISAWYHSMRILGI